MMHLLWTITYITEDGTHSFLEADNKIEAMDKVGELVRSGVSLDYITVFPHCTGQLGSDFYVEIPDLELGQYCIMFTEGDYITIDSEGIMVGNDNRFDGVYHPTTGIYTSWENVKYQVDNGVDYGTGYYKAEIDNQVTGIIKRIVRGTL